MIAPKGTGRATPPCYPSSERMRIMKSCWVNWLPGVIALLLSGGQALAQAPAEVRDPATVSGQPKIVAIRIARQDGQLLADHVAGIPLQPGDPADRGKIA